MAESQDTNTCVVCFKDVVYYSIGECDHPVCFECSTRMRVLCLQNECPICRQDLSRVVFTESIQPYKELRNQVFTDRLFERQFKIGFCSEEIKNAYEQLLENRCKYCDKLPPFRTFSMLSDHMRKAHERYFCDLCVKHLKIFTFERKCYTRQELAHHRRKGDLDDTSHRGHPLCEFCEERFMDADELYRHLRKEHLYCHLCDADGRNLYYASHAALAQHFRTDHFLCEEGECANNHLTAVFRTEIDLKAHKATVHGRGMTRGAARQARTLELQFNITPHPVVTSRGGREREREREREQQEAPSPPPQPPAAARIDTRSDAQFPRLSAAPPQPNILLGAAGGRSYNGADNLARNEKNFPCLGGGGGGGGPARPAPRPQAPAAAVLRNSKPSVSIQLHSQPASASNFRLTQAGGNRISIPQPQPQRKPPPSDDDFPSLGKRDRDLDDHPSIGAGTVQPPKIISRETHISIPQSQGKPPCDDEFPSLGKRDRDMDDHPSIEAGILQPPKVALINSQEMQSLKSNQSNPQPKKAPLSSDAFPALGGAGAGAGAAPAVPPQWITVKKDKRPARPEPPPPAPRPAFNPVADFPTLPANAKPGKKSKTPVQQQFQPPPAPKTPTPAPKPQEQTPKSKKEKKKPNPIFLDEDGAPDQGYSYINGITDKFNRQHIRDAYAAAMDNNNQPPPEAGKKIKTVVEASTADKRTNGGTGDFALAAAEFPSLNPNGVVTPVSPPSYPAKKKTPNGNAPPPPPPGFKSRPPCDGMTFTNSSGQTFPAPLHNYIPPPNFEQRNRALVKKFAVALGGAAAVEDFKVASRAFRDNIITADEFYEHCRSALGPQLDSVFPDLVALLPDIAKQQELVVGRDIGARLEVCSTCGQLLAPADRHAHDTEHWPALS